MKKEIADKWVAALRSGEYKQTRGILANYNRTEHCCLGVLCELAIEDGVGLQVLRPDGASYTSFDGEDSHLPQCVDDWADLYNCSTPITLHQSIVGLIRMNDEGRPFTEIADHIEMYWEAL